MVFLKPETWNLKPKITASALGEQRRQPFGGGTPPVTLEIGTAVFLTSKF